MRATSSVLFLTLIFALATPANATLLPSGQGTFRGEYAGVLPCPDCVGIWTDLELDDPGIDLGDGSGTFLMVERFTGGKHAGETRLTRGTWSAISHDHGAQNSGHIEVRPQADDVNPSSSRYFFCAAGTELLLDARDPAYYPAKNFPAALFRIVPSPRPIFGPLTITDGGQSLFAKIGDEFEFVLPIPSQSAKSPWRLEVSPGSPVIFESNSGSWNKTGAFAGPMIPYMLKAIAPGFSHVEFVSSQSTPRRVTFDFQVTP